MEEIIKRKQEAESGKVQIKDISAKDIKLDENEGTIVVKFASFGNRDSVGDVLIKGCFAKSINERGPHSSTNRKIAFLWQHDVSDPIGKIMDIEEKEDGAYATIKLSDFDSVPNSKRAYSQLKDGTINQFSFGFEYVWDKMEYDEDTDSYLVKEVKLFEVSVVTLGANERTEFVGFGKGQDLETYLKQLRNEKPRYFKDLMNKVNEDEAEPNDTSLTSTIVSIGNKLKEDGSKKN